MCLEPGPAGETVLPGNRMLCIGQLGVRFLLLPVAQKILGLVTQMLEIRAGWQNARHDLSLSPDVRLTGQRGNARSATGSVGLEGPVPQVGSSLPADGMRPVSRNTH